jgi:hypothetical protein
MTYFKIFTLSVISSLLFLSAFIMVAFDSDTALSQAYDYYEQGDCHAARIFLMNEDTTIPVSDFYLYEAYLAREELGLKKSQNYLQQAYNELHSKKSSTAYEITLNLAFDAFRQKEIYALESAINLSESFAMNDTSWIYFFKACHAYISHNYQLADALWDNKPFPNWLSKWMETSFTRNWSPEELQFMQIFAKIQIGNTTEAREKLFDMQETSSDDETITFFFGLCRVKDEQMREESEPESFKWALNSFNSVPEQNKFFSENKKQLINVFKDQILTQITHQDPLYLEDFLAFLEKQNAHEEMSFLAKEISTILKNKIEAKDPQKAIQCFNLIPDSQVRTLTLQEFCNEICCQISEKNFDNLLMGWIEYKDLFSKQTYFRDLIKNHLSSVILIESTLEVSHCEKALYLWNLIEENFYERTLFASQLVQHAQECWSIYNKPEAAISLMKMTESILYPNEKPIIQNEITKAIAKTYQQKILQDQMDDFGYILCAIKEFNLDANAIIDIQDVGNLLADASYQFQNGQIQSALKKAKWVLDLDPENKEAKEIAGLVLYEKGEYSEAYSLLKNLEAQNQDLKEAIYVTNLLYGNSSFMNIHSLSEEACLRIAFGYLSLSQTDNANLWLNQITTTNNEILTAKLIAASQKNNWLEVSDLYENLSDSKKNIPAIQSLAIQSFVYQNQTKQADNLFYRFVLASSFQGDIENESKPFQILRKQLSYFDRYDFASRYYLYVKNEVANAEKMSLQRVSHP